MARKVIVFMGFLILMLVFLGLMWRSPGQPSPGDAAWWEERAHWWEAQSEDWRIKAMSNLDRFKMVCDGSDFTEQTIKDWEKMVAGTGHALALSNQWVPWARERIKLFARNPEWKKACQKANARTGVSPGGRDGGRPA